FADEEQDAGDVPGRGGVARQAHRHEREERDDDDLRRELADVERPRPELRAEAGTAERNPPGQGEVHCSLPWDWASSRKYAPHALSSAARVITSSRCWYRH